MLFAQKQRNSGFLKVLSKVERHNYDTIRKRFLKRWFQHRRDNVFRNVLRSYVELNMGKEIKSFTHTPFDVVNRLRKSHMGLCDFVPGCITDVQQADTCPFHSVSGPWTATLSTRTKLEEFRLSYFLLEIPVKPPS